MARTYRSTDKYAPSYFTKVVVIDLEVAQAKPRTKKSKVAKRFKKVAQFQ